MPSINLKNITAPVQKEEDTEFEITIRPQTFDEFVGQKTLKNNLKIFISAAKKREESPEHILLYGPPGLGKTTLANIIAKETESNLKVTSAPALSKTGDIAALLTNLEPGDILFIDEIHRLSSNLEEMLFSAMEDFAIDLMMGKGAGAKSMRLPLPPFTLIGATTQFGKLSSPLRDRFGFISKLEFYNNEEIQQIANRSARILKIDLVADACEILAKCARRTPRIANRLIKRMRDFAHHHDSKRITLDIAKNTLENLQIDRKGLEQSDIEFLKLIIEKFAGGPVGLSTLAAALAEEKETLEEIVEPYLIQIGFLQRTPKGRTTTDRAYEHLGIKITRSNQNQSLF